MWVKKQLTYLWCCFCPSDFWYLFKIRCLWEIELDKWPFTGPLGRIVIRIIPCYSLRARQRAFKSQTGLLRMEMIYDVTVSIPVNNSNHTFNGLRPCKNCFAINTPSAKVEGKYCFLCEAHMTVSQLSYNGLELNYLNLTHEVNCSQLILWNASIL